MADKFLDKNGVKVLWEEACKTFVDGTNYELDKAELEQAIADAAAAEVDLSEIEQSIASAQDDIDALNGSVSDLEGDLSSLNSDVTGLNSDVSNLAGRINSLEVGAEAVDGKIESAVSSAVAGLVDSAPETFDTLKEIADYIAADEQGAADMASRISALEEAETPALTKAEIKDLCTRVYEEIVMSKYIVADKDEVLNALANIEDGGSITLEDDIDLGAQVITFPANKEVTLDLGGKELTLDSQGDYPGMQIMGDVTIENGTINATKRAVGVYDGGTLTVGEGAEVISGDCALNAVGAGSTIIMNDGEVTAQEAGILVTSGAKTVVNGGKIIGLDNGPIMSNGSAGKGDVQIEIHGGELVANIESAGYVACGVYMPNTGTLLMDGGKITANGGAGIVGRGGSITIEGDAEIVTTPHPTLTEGKVGDSRVVVKCAPVVYDKHSKYPGVDSLQITINDNAVLMSGIELETTVPGVQIVSDEAQPNITDNRTIIGE